MNSFYCMSLGNYIIVACYFYKNKFFMANLFLIFAIISALIGDKVK